MRHQRIFGVATPLLFGAALLAGGSSTALAACGLQSADNRIKHVVHIQFDNVHLRRANPNAPSDLEQMPNLLNFMQNNGTVSGNHHTPLISHTATDILTALTGVYGDRMGIPVANSYGFFRADGSVANDGGANPVSGYSLIEAANLGEAHGKARGCPLLANGGSIEIAEAIDM